MGKVELARTRLMCDKSILDCEPSSIEEKPSEDERGGVSPPELEVQVLDRECHDYALPANMYDDVEAIEGFSTILALLGESRYLS